MSYKLTKSPVKGKKYRVISPGGTIVDFGASGYSDYTKHKDPKRKERYIKRHKKMEDWTNPETAGFWSRWLLWNMTTIKESIKDIEKRFPKVNVLKGGSENLGGIDELKAKTLSNHEIMEKIKNKANLMTYSELMDYDDLDDALGPHGAMVLLYETKKNFGHWTCVFKRNNLIEHFDSYGYYPDDELKFVPEYFRTIEEIDYPHLTALLYKSPYKLSYNEHKLQKHEKDTNTCGRWCIARLLLRHLTLKEFSKLFKGKAFDPDFLVTIFTELI